MVLTKIKLKRAIQSCKNRIEHHYKHTNNKKSKAIENEYIKIEALKKQIPKNSIKKNKYHFICPSCKKELNIEEEDILIYNQIPPNYCEFCGQKLCWEMVKNDN